MAKLIGTGFREKRDYTTQDGHRYVSVPAEVPIVWTRKSVSGVLSYASGEYVIIRHGDGSHRTYVVWRNGQELHLSFTGSLKGAKGRAVLNARGLDFFNWA